MGTYLIVILSIYVIVMLLIVTEIVILEYNTMQLNICN